MSGFSPSLIPCHLLCDNPAAAGRTCNVWERLSVAERWDVSGDSAVALLLWVPLQLLSSANSASLSESKQNWTFPLETEQIP